MEFSKTEKLAILKHLELVVKADGVIHEKEKEFLLAAVINFNITLGEAKGTKDLELVDAVKTLVKMNSEKKEYVKDLILKLSIVDGDFHINEMLLVSSLFKVLV